MNQDSLIKTPGHELFQRLAQTLTGQPIETVLSAAVNLQVNALRQTYPDRAKALARLDELHAQARNALANQYTASGKRLEGTYPFHQTIVMPMLVDRSP